ncbi:MAG: hypothetical protein HEQ38_10650 [Gemmatimonas sp.]|nr:hypothetical protein [Gemmatimonas sp.]
MSPRDRQKQVSREDTFARDLDDDTVIERELLRLAVRVSSDLRRQGAAGPNGNGQDQGHGLPHPVGPAHPVGVHRIGKVGAQGGPSASAPAPRQAARSGSAAGDFPLPLRRRAGGAPAARHAAGALCGVPGGSGVCGGDRPGGVTPRPRPDPGTGSHPGSLWIRQPFFRPALWTRHTIRAQG